MLCKWDEQFKDELARVAATVWPGGENNSERRLGNTVPIF